MTARKVLCPGCQSSLNVTQTLPANLRCPRCQARFQAAADGAAYFHEEPAGTGRLAVLAAVFGACALFLVVGVGVLALCLLAPAARKDTDTVDADDSPPPAPPKSASLEPVGFTKKTPAAAKAVAAAGAAKARAGDAPGVAKNAGNAEVSWSPRQKEIDAAIAKGVDYLKSLLDDNGQITKEGNNRVGASALIGLTLVSCGVPANDPKVVGILKRVRAEAHDLRQTYDLAVCIWLLDLVDQPSDRDTIRSMAARLIAGQGDGGGWDYNCKTLSAEHEEKLLSLVAQPFVPLTAAPDSQPPVKDPAKEPGKQPPPKVDRGTVVTDVTSLPVVKFQPGQTLKRPTKREDNSLTQFAVLALWVAQKHGIPAQRSLAMAEARFRSSQLSSGGWGYSWGVGNWQDSMTCAGLVGLATGKGAQPGDAAGKDKAVGDLGKDPEIERALKYLGGRLRKLGMPLAKEERDKVEAEVKSLREKLQTAGPGERLALQQRLDDLNELLNRGKAMGANRLIHASANGDLYFIWSVERVAVLYGLRTIGGTDWYGWGVDILLPTQAANGSWTDTHTQAVDTCFALLFLKRVNVAQDLTKALANLGGARDPGAKPGEHHPSEEDVLCGNKVNPSVQPGQVKVRGGYALPAGNQPPRRTRRRKPAA
jgi:hypothetical protein